MAVDNTNNLPVAVDGYDAVIGTDIFVSAGETAHAQVMKVAWGDNSTVTRATVDTPLPVKVYGLTGPLSTVTVTGAVRGLGTFTVGNTAGSPVYVTGGVNAFVYGITGATPVAITGSVSISSNVGITGVVNVTGGRYLNLANDSVTVTGSVARSWTITKATDGIAVYGSDGGTAIYAKIAGSDGTVIGASGNALNVNVIGAGISATVSIGATVGVDNAAGTILKVQGDATGTPLPVNGTVSLAANTQVQIDPVQTVKVNAPVSALSYASSFNTATDDFNNFEKLFIAQNGSNNHTVAAWLKFLWNAFTYSGGDAVSIGKTIQGIDSGNVSVSIKNKIANNIYMWQPDLYASGFSQLDDPAINVPLGYSVSISHGVWLKNITNTFVSTSTVYNKRIGISNISTGNPIGMILEPGETIFIPSRITSLYAKILDVTGDTSPHKAISITAL
jgi:hypothetical protein